MYMYIYWGKNETASITYNQNFSLNVMLFFHSFVEDYDPTIG